MGGILPTGSLTLTGKATRKPSSCLLPPKTPPPPIPFFWCSYSFTWGPLYGKVPDAQLLETGEHSQQKLGEPSTCL